MPLLQKCLVLGVFGTLGLISIGIIISHFAITAHFGQNRSAGAPYPSNGTDNLFHLAQVSDIHISAHHEPQRTADFEKLCEDMEHVIKPDILLITGDLTDAKSANKLYSEQYREEWEAFTSSISALKKTRLVAIRGNHDAFNEPDQKNSQYMHYVRDNLTATTELFTITKPYGNYSLVAIDGAPVPGFKRPFNFVGYVGQDSLDKLSSIRDQSRHTNQTVLFGHYPTSTMYHARQMRDIFGSMSLAYLCGHLHNGAGLVPHMQHMHSSGVAELELGDWKKNRVFRIMSMDHDLFAFSDHKWRESGIYTHIANPPEWRLTNPSKQPMDRIAKSTHVRVLIFSSGPVASAKAVIDGDEVPLTYIIDNLWVAPWTPLDRGVVVVHAQAANGANSTTTHQYRLHYESLMSSEFSLAATFILSVDFCVYFSAAFWLGVSIPLFFMIIMSKIYSKLSGRQPLQLKWNFFLRFQILFGYEPYFTHLAAPLGAWSLWIMFMPWFVGDMIDDDYKYGLVGTWGVYIPGRGLHRQHEVYATGFWDVVTFLWPSYLYTSYFAERRWSSKCVSPWSSGFNLVHGALLVAIFWLRCTALHQIIGSYGWSCFASPVFLFPILFSCYSSYFIYFKLSSVQL